MTARTTGFSSHPSSSKMMIVNKASKTFSPIIETIKKRVLEL